MYCIWTACSVLVACYITIFVWSSLRFYIQMSNIRLINKVCVLLWCWCPCIQSFSFSRRATLLSARQGMMSARGDFLNYALSLMRSHNDEHSDVLPVLDVCSLKHVAYVFQALIYWIKAMNQQTTLDTPQLERKRYWGWLLEKKLK